jgi:hypothetical protein
MVAFVCLESSLFDDGLVVESRRGQTHKFETGALVSSDFSKPYREKSSPNFIRVQSL